MGSAGNTRRLHTGDLERERERDVERGPLPDLLRSLWRLLSLERERDLELE